VLYTKEQGKRRFLICDGAMNDLIRPALYEGFHEIVPVTGPAGGARSKMDVVGPVCESADFLAQDRMLPTRIQEGDLLAVLDAGAYGFSMASNYNSRPRPPEILIEKDRFRVIRPRETLDDLLARERALC
jgi:diaminopimelate decarboxylase